MVAERVGGSRKLAFDVVDALRGCCAEDECEGGTTFMFAASAPDCLEGVLSTCCSVRLAVEVRREEGGA